MNPASGRAIWVSRRARNSVVIIAVLLTVLTWSSPQTTAPSEWKAVEEAMGRPGQMQPGDVIKFGMPRKDLHVTVGEVVVKPGLALGSWAAFKRTENGTMVMGDLVLTEDEVEPVMRASCRKAGLKFLRSTTT